MNGVRGAAAAGCLALVASLTACGGDDDDGGGASASESVSTDDFCEAFNGLIEKVVSQATADDPSAMVKAVKDWAADIEEVGTPEDMPEDAKRGFDVFVEEARNIDDDATLQDLENLGQDLSSADQRAAEAFGDWTQDNCPLGVGGLPSMDPSDLPSLDPENLPSGLPADPSELESLVSELSASAGS